MRRFHRAADMDGHRPPVAHSPRAAYAAPVWPAGTRSLRPLPRWSQAYAAVAMPSLYIAPTIVPSSVMSKALAPAGSGSLTAVVEPAFQSSTMLSLPPELPRGSALMTMSPAALIAGTGYTCQSPGGVSSLAYAPFS